MENGEGAWHLTGMQPSRVAHLPVVQALQGSGCQVVRRHLGRSPNCVNTSMVWNRIITMIIDVNATVHCVMRCIQHSALTGLGRDAGP